MLDLFRIALGLEIDGEASLLSGDGAPGGDSAEQDAAAIGSIYMRTDVVAGVSQTYVKKGNANTAADWVQNASKDYVDALVSGLSWRDPARLLDSTSTSIADATASADATDEIDGVTIAEGDRILFTGFTTDNNNVYIVSGSSGNWTFTEDSKSAEAGDAILITEGTHSSEQWIYDGTDWLHFGGVNSNLELGFIRDFIGKATSGAVLPTYSSTNIVTNNDSLQTAIGDLDAAIGDRTYTDENFITNGQTISVSLDELDQALQDAYDAIGDRIYTEENFVTNGESLTDSIDALDVALGSIKGLNESTETGVTALTTIDEVLVDETDSAKWFVVVIDEATPARKNASEVYAIHNGTDIADATLVEFNRTGIIRTQVPPISNLNVVVDVSGTGPTQTMRLRVSAGVSVTVKATRISVLD